MRNTIVSKFKNFKDTNPKDVSLWDWLHDTTYKDEVEFIRNTTNKDDRTFLKSKLPAITPSGVFCKRNASSLIKHSGFICIDIDAGDNPRISNFEQLRDELSKISNIAYASVSVSGNGVFALIPIQFPEKHKEHFEALKKCFEKLCITLDKACSDITRLRGYSYDVNAYINENAVVFKHVVENNRKEKASKEKLNKKKKTLKNTNSKVIDTINKVINSGIDLTEKYEQWFQIGCALASEFGEEGREMFDLISQNHPKYSSESCDSFYSKCIENNYGYSIGTFFYWAEQYGFVQKGIA
ncbi:PriCT-2 domain-containing protein [Flavobacterium sp. 17A]|uniref:PriCT-2 domain-containing protein n=1 Tax=Flavobacterium potami TaxID=2872310 RepID=A0A9X1HEJ2_9FLAO|nr:BT4734/BF3469 family protein [Flavobacterium potami]MBZ4037305.1 PriCT-2 domain-containing protein [Flavobacterium potami]